MTRHKIPVRKRLMEILLDHNIEPDEAKAITETVIQCFIWNIEEMLSGT